MFENEGCVKEKHQNTSIVLGIVYNCKHGHTFMREVTDVVGWYHIDVLFKLIVHQDYMMDIEVIGAHFVLCLRYTTLVHVQLHANTTTLGVPL
mgnify:FL=1